jgi:hypothetical protein
MGLASLLVFMAGVWAMILAVSAFLVVFVAPIETYLFRGQGERLTVSAVQAAIAIILMMLLVFGLNRLKRMYLYRKLSQ